MGILSKETRKRLASLGRKGARSRTKRLIAAARAGGKARAKQLTAKRRRAIAKNAAKARWAGEKRKDK